NPFPGPVPPGEGVGGAETIVPQALAGLPLAPAFFVSGVVLPRNDEQAGVQARTLCGSSSRPVSQRHHRTSQGLAPHPLPRIALSNGPRRPPSAGKVSFRPVFPAVPGARRPTTPSGARGTPGFYRPGDRAHFRRQQEMGTLDLLPRPFRPSTRSD